LLGYDYINLKLFEFKDSGSALLGRQLSVWVCGPRGWCSCDPEWLFGLRGYPGGTLGV